MHDVAIWGAGTMGRMHAGCYERSGEARVAYVIDQDIGRASLLASQHGAMPVAEPETALGDRDVEVVDVCLPTWLHRDATEQAARHGKHVFCEKPMALCPEDARAMISACRSGGVKLGIAHVLRYFPEYEMARHIVASGDLGRIGVVRLARVGPFPRGWTDWYAAERRSGGVLLDLSIHDFDFLAWCFGPVERIYARKVRQEDRPMGYGLAVVRMRCGVIAHVEGSWAHPGPFSYMFEICGSTGMIEYDSLKARPVSVLTETAQGSGTPATPGVAVPESPLKDKEPYLQEIREFLAYVRGECVTPRVLPQDAIYALEISLAAVRSADTGQVVSLA